MAPRTCHRMPLVTVKDTLRHPSPVTFNNLAIREMSKLAHPASITATRSALVDSLRSTHWLSQENQVPILLNDTLSQAKKLRPFSTH